ncbi:hypothetical protein CCR95_08610 [Thiocystis minor]|uniref:hypothetical protein n=1 Tax=Thiocystis minor TaxID=61597 RepID=UPI001911E026|nr:hypothetical protein [Thiocystis minor]MBK5964143.1 hypothetical protein [Thiocystis minor]
MDQYEVYEYIHPDGRTKTWGYRRLPTGEIEVRWGPEHRLSQHKIYPASADRKVRKTAVTKVREGYRDIGRHAINTSNDLVFSFPPKSVSPVGRPAVVNQTVPDVTPPRPRVPAFDLSQIDTEIPDLGWF